MRSNRSRWSSDLRMPPPTTTTSHGRRFAPRSRPPRRRHSRRVRTSRSRPRPRRRRNERYRRRSRRPPARDPRVRAPGTGRVRSPGPVARGRWCPPSESSRASPTPRWERRRAAAQPGVEMSSGRRIGQQCMTDETLQASTTVAVPAEECSRCSRTRRPILRSMAPAGFRKPVDRAPLTEVGQIFRMDMYHPNHPNGDYRVANKVAGARPAARHRLADGAGRRATVSWSSAAGSGVTTWRRSVRPRPRSRSPTTGRRCRSSSGSTSSSRRSALSISPTRCTTWPSCPRHRNRLRSDGARGRSTAWWTPAEGPIRGCTDAQPRRLRPPRDVRARLHRRTGRDHRTSHSISKVVVALADGAAIADGTRLRGRPLSLDLEIWPFFAGFLDRQTASGRAHLRAVRLRHL